MNATLDESRRRLEITSEIFADRLRFFVQKWKPEHPQDIYDFQMDLTRLMVDAMRNQSSSLSLGINHYAEQIYAEMALRPLTVIMQDPKK